MGLVQHMVLVCLQQVVVRMVALQAVRPLLVVQIMALLGHPTALPPQLRLSHPTHPQADPHLLHLAQLSLVPIQVAQRRRPLHQTHPLPVPIQVAHLQRLSHLARPLPILVVHRQLPLAQHMAAQVMALLQAIPGLGPLLDHPTEAPMLLVQAMELLQVQAMVMLQLPLQALVLQVTALLRLPLQVLLVVLAMALLQLPLLVLPLLQLPLQVLVDQAMAPRRLLPQMLVVQAMAPLLPHPTAVLILLVQPTMQPNRLKLGTVVSRQVMEPLNLHLVMETP